MKTEINLYTLATDDDKKIFIPAIDLDTEEPNRDLLSCYLYTHKDYSKDLMDSLRDLGIKGAKLASMPLEDVLSDFLLTIRRNGISLVYLDSDEIFPLTQAGYEYIQDLLAMEGEEEGFVDVEDGIHSLLIRLCSKSGLDDEKTSEIFDLVSIQYTLEEEGDQFIASFEYDGPDLNTKFLVKVTVESKGLTVHNEDYTFTAPVFSEETVKRVKNRLGKREYGHFWAEMDEDRNLYIDTTKLEDHIW